MSLSSPIEFSMRPEDKGFDYYGSPLDDHFNDFFDQYVNEDSLESSDDSKALDFTVDFDNVFDAGTSSSSTDDISPNARHRQSSPEPWRKGLWCLNGSTALPSYHPTPCETNVHALVSPASIEALSLTATGLGIPNLEAELSILSTTFPSTPPTTPSRKVTKNFVTTPKTLRRRHPNDRRGGRSSMSPTLMNHISKNGLPLEDWTAQRLQDFHLRVPDEELPHSPPPTRLMQHETPMRLTVPPQVRTQPNMRHQNGEDDHLGSLNGSHQQQQQQQQQHLVSSPNMKSMRNQTSYFAQALTTSASLNSRVPTTSEPLMSSPQVHLSQIQSLQPWQSAPLDSTEFEFGASPDLQSTQAETWWSPTSPASAVQPCATPLHAASGYHQLAQPAPQRPVHGLLQANEAQYVSESSGEGFAHSNGGLTIQYGSPAPNGANAPSSHFSPSALAPIMTDYPPLPSVDDTFGQASTFTSQWRRQRTPPSLSPSVSPTNPSWVHKSRASPPASAHPHATRSSRRQSHGRRTKSAATTPKTPCTPGYGNVDFVNFTPHDSKKILTGVAPSGSSKTKARREQEAREKRRKLSEVAMRAVRSGDVEALEAVLC